jgi:hypothetical protein
LLPITLISFSFYFYHCIKILCLIKDWCLLAIGSEGNKPARGGNGFYPLVFPLSGTLGPKHIQLDHPCWALDFQIKMVQLTYFDRLKSYSVSTSYTVAGRKRFAGISSGAVSLCVLMRLRKH